VPHTDRVSPSLACTNLGSLPPSVFRSCSGFLQLFGGASPEILREQRLASEGNRGRKRPNEAKKSPFGNRDFSNGPGGSLITAQSVG
jgi:hypothetical protein